MNRDVFHALGEEFKAVPYIAHDEIDLTDISGGYALSMDINKAYSNILLNNKADWCVFSVCDCIEEFEENIDTFLLPGEYYIENGFEMEKGSGIFLKRGFYNYVLIQYCIDKKYTTLSNIKY